MDRLRPGVGGADRPYGGCLPVAAARAAAGTRRRVCRGLSYRPGMTAQVLRELVLVRASTDELLAGLAAEHWSDADIRQASLLPDWTRGHVLTHIARNADGITRTVSAALRGEQVDRYPRGPEGRAADIEAGAHRSAGELLADVRDSAYRLDQAFTEAQGADGWELPT